MSSSQGHCLGEKVGVDLQMGPAGGMVTSQGTALGTVWFLAPLDQPERTALQQWAALL